MTAKTNCVNCQNETKNYAPTRHTKCTQISIQLVKIMTKTTKQDILNNTTHTLTHKRIALTIPKTAKTLEITTKLNKVAIKKLQKLKIQQHNFNKIVVVHVFSYHTDVL